MTAHREIRPTDLPFFVFLMENNLPKFDELPKLWYGDKNG